MGMFLRRGTNRKVTVTITKTTTATVLHEDYAYAIVDGVKYYRQTVLEVNRGTVVEIYVGTTNADYDYKCYVAIDEKRVQRGAGIYRYTVKKPSTLTFYAGHDTAASWRHCIITRE